MSDGENLEKLTDADALKVALGRLLPDEVAIATGPVKGDYPDLFPDEEAAVLGAVRKRQDEFKAGRSLARLSLGQWGCEPTPIPRTDDRQPTWPEGFLGSISHSDFLCAAIAARTDAFVGLGVDMEPSTPLKTELRSRICRPEEMPDLDTPLDAPEGSVDRAKLVFVAKEAVFKAYYPTVGYFLGFQEARLDLDQDTPTFRAHLVGSEPPLLNGSGLMRGAWALAADHVVAVVVVPRDQAD